MIEESKIEAATDEFWSKKKKNKNHVGVKKDSTSRQNLYS